MPDPLAGWVRISTQIPGHLGTADELYKHDSGARLALLEGQWELHYRRMVRQYQIGRTKIDPPFSWANGEIKSVESM